MSTAAALCSVSRLPAACVTAPRLVQVRPESVGTVVLNVVTEPAGVTNAPLPVTVPPDQVKDGSVRLSLPVSVPPESASPLASVSAPPLEKSSVPLTSVTAPVAVIPALLPALKFTVPPPTLKVPAPVTLDPELKFCVPPVSASTASGSTSKCPL